MAYEELPLIYTKDPTRTAWAGRVRTNQADQESRINSNDSDIASLQSAIDAVVIQNNLHNVSSEQNLSDQNEVSWSTGNYTSPERHVSIGKVSNGSGMFKVSDMNGIYQVHMSSDQVMNSVNIRPTNLAYWQEAGLWRCNCIGSLTSSGVYDTYSPGKFQSWDALGNSIWRTYGGHSYEWLGHPWLATWDITYPVTKIFGVMEAGGLQRVMTIENNHQGPRYRWSELHARLYVSGDLLKMAYRFILGTRYEYTYASAQQNLKGAFLSS